MLSEKKFRERAKVELREIGKPGRQSRQRTVTSIGSWSEKLSGTTLVLQKARSPFIDMVRGAYADAMAMRVLRLLDSGTSGLSLTRTLAQIADYPQVRHDKVSDREFAHDCAALEKAAAKLKSVIDPHFKHHERTPSALASTHRQLDQAIDQMISTLKTYYWVIAEGHLDLDVKYAEDPLAIFKFAWIEAVVIWPSRQLTCKPQVSFSSRYGVAARLWQTTSVISQSPRFELACRCVPHIERELGWPRRDPQSTAFLAPPCRP